MGADHDELVPSGPGAGRDPVDVVLIGRAPQDSLALSYVASACDRAELRAEIAAIADDSSPEEAVKAVRALSPTAVGLSIAGPGHAPAMTRVAETLRALGFRGHICAGGLFASVASDEVLRDTKALDSVVRNDAEETTVELLALLQREPRPGAEALSGIAGLSFRSPDGAIVHNHARALPPLDSLAWPRRRGRTARRMGIGIAQMLGSRRGHGAWTAGDVHGWHRPAEGMPSRQRSVEDVAREMVWLRREHGVQIFDFQDDNFFVPSHDQNLARLRQLEASLRADGVDDVGLVIRCRPSDLSPEVLDALERIGVIRVYAGIGAAGAPGDRSRERGEASVDDERALQGLAHRGIAHALSVLLFDPDTTMESVLPNVELLEAHASVPFNFCCLQVHAKTPLEGQLLRQGRLHGSYLAWAYDLDDPRADLMLRIAAVAFRQRNVDAAGAAKSILGLRFDEAVMRRFHPRATAPAIVEAATDLSRRLGVSSVAHLRDLHAFASEVDADDASLIQDYTAQLAQRIHRQDVAFLAELADLRAAMNAAVGRVSAQTPPQS